MGTGAKRIVLLLGVTVLLLGVAEGVCRLLPGARSAEQRALLPWLTPNLYQPVDDARGYAFRPRAQAQINGLGMRGREVAVRKDGGTFRVLVVGDSIAYGVGVGAQETFAALLERRLRERRPGRRIEVLNAGVPGYNSAQELAYLRELGLALDPDAVVLAWCSNDMQVTPIVYHAGDSFLAWRPNRQERRFGGLLYERSSLYRRVVAALMAADTGATSDEDWHQNLLALRELTGLLRQAGIPTCGVLFPYLHDSWQLRPAQQALREQAADAFAREGHDVIELLDHWRQRAPAELRIAELDDDWVHPNATGHADVAERLERWILGRGLLVR